MKLLLLCESFPTSINGDFTGGVEARDFFTARELTKKHSVTIITNARKNSPRQQQLHRLTIIRSGIAISHHFRNNPFTRVWFFFTSIVTGLTLNFDLVQGSNIYTQAAAFALGILKHKPKIALVHDVYLNHWFARTDPITATIGEMLERIIFKLPWDHFIANSQTTKRQLTSLGIKPGQITVIPGGVNYQHCYSLPVTKYSYPTIIFAGRLVKYKRVADLINALPYIKAQIPNIQLKIIGTGPELNALQTLTANLHLRSHLSFLGFVPSHRQVITTIKRSHLFCLPSTVEGFGLVTLEALASGVPYINSNIPATLELTQKGRGGLLFKAQDPKDLAKQALMLLTDKQLYRQKQREGKNLAQSFSWSRTAQQTATLFLCITKQHGKT